MQERGFSVLIVTVGQTIAPLEVSLAEHAPDGVVFIASQDSQPVVGELVQSYGNGLRHHTLLLDDPENLTESFRLARKALVKALEWEARVILADLTGGTKPMVVGAALALSGQGVSFSYVGGSRRDAQGRVESGAERLRLLEDPTHRFGVREWEGFRRAWNAGNYPAALDFLQELISRPLAPSEGRFYKHLAGITEGMVAWDCFQHAVARDKLATHLEPALAIAEAWGHGAKVRVLQGLQQALSGLEALVKGQGPSFELLADLLSNALRRAESGRYDDALARLYRAIELAAEADVHEHSGVVLRRADTYPQPLQDLALRAGKVTGLKEALALAFELDTRLKHTNTLAQRLYGDYNSRLQSLIQKRHHSILAHGTKPVDRSAFEAMWAYVQELGLQEAAPWPRW